MERHWTTITTAHKPLVAVTSLGTTKAGGLSFAGYRTQEELRKIGQRGLAKIFIPCPIFQIQV